MRKKSVCSPCKKIGVFRPYVGTSVNCDGCQGTTFLSVSCFAHRYAARHDARRIGHHTMAILELERLRCGSTCVWLNFQSRCNNLARKGPVFIFLWQDGWSACWMTLSQTGAVLPPQQQQQPSIHRTGRSTSTRSTSAGTDTGAYSARRSGVAGQGMALRNTGVRFRRWMKWLGAMCHPPVILSSPSVGQLCPLRGDGRRRGQRHLQPLRKQMSVLRAADRVRTPPSLLHFVCFLSCSLVL